MKQLDVTETTDPGGLFGLLLLSNSCKFNLMTHHVHPDSLSDKFKMLATAVTKKKIHFTKPVKLIGLYKNLESIKNEIYLLAMQFNTKMLARLILLWWCVRSSVVCAQARGTHAPPHGQFTTKPPSPACVGRT